jgi:broad specificity phosphatase PhoE
MSTIALLVRHGHTDVIGRRLVGRLPGIPLSETGQTQVERLRRSVAAPLAAIYSSPLERALATARPLAAARNLEAQIREDLNEVDFGQWTGMTFDELSDVPEWREFNRNRLTAAVPGGERACDVQSRILAALDHLRLKHEGQMFAVVSHADVIRAAVLHYAGISLQLFHTIEIDTASVTAVELAATPRLLFVNSRGPFLWNRVQGAEPSIHRIRQIGR